MFELEQLRSFVVLAAELHYGRAAYRLNITQSPLSRRIQALEHILGVTLFERSARGVTLTAPGRLFLPEAKAVMVRSEAALRIVAQNAPIGTGQVTIGFVGATTYDFLPRFVDMARRMLPRVALILREMDSVAQVGEILAGRMDIGLVRPGAVHDNLRTMCVHRERLALAIPVDHPLAGRRRIELKDIHGQPFIAYSAEGRYLRDLIDVSLKRANVVPDVVQSLAHAQAILALVGISLGIAIVPEQTSKACFDNIVFRPLSLDDAASAELHATWRPVPGVATNAVLQLLTDMGNATSMIDVTVPVNIRPRRIVKLVDAAASD